MPLFSYQAGIVNYNTYIRNTLVPAQQALGRKVTLVDQYAPFLTNPADLTTIDQSLFSNGINHPDNDGYDKMAQVWLDGIKALGLGPNAYSNWIAGFPGVGALTGSNDDPDGDGQTNQEEFAFGLNPTTGASVNPITQQLDKATGVFKYTRTKDSGLSYKIYYSTSLSAWTLDAAATQSPAAAVAGVETVTVTLAAAPVDGKLFVRVVASPVP